MIAWWLTALPLRAVRNPRRAEQIAAAAALVLHLTGLC